MPTKDSFDPADPLPRFLAGEPEQQDIENVRAGGAIASRVFMSILVAAAIATGVAALAMGDPVALFTDVTASLIGRPSPRPGTDASPPAIQSADNAPALIQANADAKADAQISPPTTNDPPTHDQVAAADPAASDSMAKDPTANDPTTKDPAETIAPSSEALFRRFQTWMSEQDAQAKAESAQDAPTQGVQDTPAQADENVRAPRRLAQKHRQAPAVRHAHAEMRTQNVRRQTIQRAQDARAARPPLRSVQDARAQEEPSAGPNTPAPSFLPPIFGQRN